MSKQLFYILVVEDESQYVQTRIPNLALRDEKTEECEGERPEGEGWHSPLVEEIFQFLQIDANTSKDEDEFEAEFEQGVGSRSKVGSKEIYDAIEKLLKETPLTDAVTQIASLPHFKEQVSGSEVNTVERLVAGSNSDEVKRRWYDFVASVQKLERAFPNDSKFGIGWYAVQELLDLVDLGFKKSIIKALAWYGMPKDDIRFCLARNAAEAELAIKYAESLRAGRGFDSVICDLNMPLGRPDQSETHIATNGTPPLDWTMKGALPGVNTSSAELALHGFHVLEVLATEEFKNENRSTIVVSQFADGSDIQSRYKQLATEKKIRVDDWLKKTSDEGVSQFKLRRALVPFYRYLDLLSGDFVLRNEKVKTIFRQLLQIAADSYPRTWSKGTNKCARILFLGDKGSGKTKFAEIFPRLLDLVCCERRKLLEGILLNSSTREKIGSFDEIRKYLCDEVSETDPETGLGEKKIRYSKVRDQPSDSLMALDFDFSEYREIFELALRERDGRTTSRLEVQNCAALIGDAGHGGLIDLFGANDDAFVAGEGNRGVFEVASHYRYPYPTDRTQFISVENQRELRVDPLSAGVTFLDEFSVMDERLQAAVLNAIEDGTVKREGGRITIPFACHVLFATNEGTSRLRDDLLDRITYVFDIPPLHERLDEVIPLIELFSRKKNGDEDVKISTDAEEKILRAVRRGENDEKPLIESVRQLRQIASLYVGETEITESNLGALQRKADVRGFSLEDEPKDRNTRSKCKLQFTHFRKEQCNAGSLSELFDLEFLLADSNLIKALANHFLNPAQFNGEIRSTTRPIKTWCERAHTKLEAGGLGISDGIQKRKWHFLCASAVVRVSSLKSMSITHLAQHLTSNENGRASEFKFLSTELSACFEEAGLSVKVSKHRTSLQILQQSFQEGSVAEFDTADSSNEFLTYLERLRVHLDS